MNTVLPEEVERDIFELVAYTDLKVGFILLQVAKHVSHWIAPILYKIVITGSSEEKNRPKSNLSQPDIQRYGMYIRHLLISLGCPYENVELYLRYCPNITDLSIWRDYEFTQSTLDLIQRLPLERVSFVTRDMHESGTDEEAQLQLQKAFSSFSQVTHFEATTGFMISHLPCLQYLPNLTHLSFPNSPFLQTPEWTQAFCDIFKFCPKLKVIILLRERQISYEGSIHYAADQPQISLRRDGRVVSCIVSDYVDDWIRGASGEPDVWDFGLKNIRTKEGSRR